MNNCTETFPAKILALVETEAPEVAAILNWSVGCDHVVHGRRYIFSLLPPDKVVFVRGSYSYTAAAKWSAAQVNACS